MGGGHGRDQLAHVDWGEVRSHVLASDLHQLGKSGRHDWVGQFAEDLRQHQLLALHSADVTQLVVAEAQESFQCLPFEQLPSGIEVDVEALAVVDVGHPFGDVDLDAADGIRQSLNGVQVQHQIAVDLGGEELAELRLDHLGAATAVEGVGLHHAVALGVDEGVPGDLGELGAALVEMHRQHHVGVGADIVGTQDDDASIARGHRGHQ